MARVKCTIIIIGATIINLSSYVRSANFKIGGEIGSSYVRLLRFWFHHSLLFYRTPRCQVSVLVNPVISLDIFIIFQIIAI